MKSSVRNPFLVVFLFLLLGLNCSGGPDDGDITEPQETLEEKLDRISKEASLPSFAVCIVNEDSIMWRYHYGMADIERNRPSNEETIYTVASVSKLVTATAVMQLVESGQLDLDEDINTYLNFEVRNPGFPDAPITSRMLLSHRSGLSAPASGSDPTFYTPFEQETAPELGAWLEEYITRGVAWTSNSPGSAENYSNHGAALLGYIVERISGLDFRVYCVQNIFAPLGMHSTSFDLNDLNSDKMAIPYHNSTHFQYSVPYYPATSLKTTINDFAKFAMMYINRGTFKGTEILKSETVDEMLRIQNSGSSLGMLWWTYAAGWKGHAGAYVGSTAFVEINNSSRKRGVIMFINKTQWLMSNGSIIYPGGKLFDLIHSEANHL